MLTGDQVLAFVLLDVVIILIAARAMGWVFVKVGQPRVVGEIVAGVLLGPTLLGPKLFTWTSSWSYLECSTSIQASPAGTEPSITTCLFPQQSRSVLGVLGQIALVLFMFLVGLELDYSALAGKLKGIALVSFGAVATPIALAYVISPVLYDDTFAFSDGGTLSSKSAFTLLVAGMLTVSAFPVMARILQEKGLTATALGAVSVASAAVVTVAMFLVVALAKGVAQGESGTGITTRFVLVAVYIAVMFLVVRPALAPFGRRFEHSGVLTGPMFALVMILLFASAYVAHSLGVNVIVGGFLAGAVLPARQQLFRALVVRLSDLTAVVLLPIFLAFSGLNTDFTVLTTESIVGILVLLVAAVVAKWGGCAVFARLGGLSWTEGSAVGILMNCRGLLVLVVGLVGVQQQVISPQLQVAGVVVALVTTMMTGPLFDQTYKRLPPEPQDGKALTGAV